MRTKYSILNATTSFISNIVSFLFIFISQTLLIKILGIEYTGINGLFNNVLTLLNLFELGLGSSITYSLYKYVKKNDKDTIKSIMCFYKIAYRWIALIVLVIGLLLIPFLNYIVKVSVDINIYYVYILFLINTVLTYIITYKRNLLIANQREYIISIADIIYAVVLNVIQILILIFTKNYYLYLGIKIVCVILENIVINTIINKKYPYICSKNIKKLSIKIKKNITDRVKALVVHKTSAVITNGTDNILISIFFGIKTVGLYTSYNYIISALVKLFSNALGSITPSVGNLIVENNKNNNYIAFKKVSFLNYFIAIVTSTCLLILAEPFIKLWLGKEYLLSNIVLIVLVINYFQTMMRSSYISFKDGAGIWIEDRFIPVLQSVINLASSIIFLKIFGLVGVFMGTILSSFVLWFYSYPKYVYKNLLDRSYKEYVFKFISKILVFVFIEVGVVFITKYIVVNNLILELAIKLIISLVVSLLVLIILYRKSDEYKYYKNLIKSKIKKV